MNYPVWELGMGAGALLAWVSVLHVFVWHFAVGGCHLDTHFLPATFAKRTPGLNQGIFAVLLVSGVGVMVWMLRQLYIAWER